MVQVSDEEAKIRLTDLIIDAINGETVFITQNGQQVVQLVPVNQPERRPRFGSAGIMWSVFSPLGGRFWHRLSVEEGDRRRQLRT